MQQQWRIRARPKAMLAFILPLLLSIVSCGLPSVDYLYPPAAFSQEGETIIHFQHEVRNTDESSDIFKGYDIYYHIFESLSDAQKCLLDMRSFSGSGSSFVSWFRNTSYNYPFSRLLRISSGDAVQSESEPFIIPTAGYSSFSINLNPYATWTLSCNEDPAFLFNIRRFLLSGSHPDFFSRTSYGAGDADYTGTSNPLAGSLYIIFFAVAVGDSSESIGQKVYSTPVIIPAPDVGAPIISFSIQ